MGCRPQGFAFEPGQPFGVGFQHLCRHGPDLIQGAYRRREGIHGDGVHHVFGISIQVRFHGQVLDRDVGLVHRGALGRQAAHPQGAESLPVHIDRHLHTASLGEVVDVAFVADVTLEPEGFVQFLRFDDPGAVLGAPHVDLRALHFQVVHVGVFLVQHLRVVVVGSGGTAEIGLVAVAFQGPLRAAEPGNVLRQVSGGFGHEVAEVAHHFPAHLLMDVIGRILEPFPQDVIQVPAVPLVFQFQEPVHVVDAGAQVVDPVLGDLCIGGDQVQGGLHAVAEPDIGYRFGELADGMAHRAHGIGIVQEQGARGGQFLHILHHAFEHRESLQAAHHAAGAQAVGDALVHTVFQGNLVVVSESLDTADVDHVDHIVGVLHRFPPVQGGHHRGRHPVVGDHPFQEFLHPLQLGPGAAHQPEFQVRQARGGEDIAGQGLGEDDAPGADHGDSRHVQTPSFCLVLFRRAARFTGGPVEFLSTNDDST